MSSNTTPLASHAGPSFFQSWAQRGLPEIAEPRASSPNVSPACLDNVGHQNEVEASYSKKIRRPLSLDPLDQDATAPYTSVDSTVEKYAKSLDALKNTYNPSKSSLSGRAGSKSSSKSSRARKRFRLPNLGIASKATKEGPPSTQPTFRQGPGRNVERKHQSRGMLISASEGATSHSRPTFGSGRQPVAKSDTANLLTEEQAAFSASPGSTKRRPKSASRRDSGKQVLYDRSKRLLDIFGRGSSFETKLDPASPRARTKTLQLLDSATSALAQGPDQPLTPPSPATIASTRSANARLLSGWNNAAASSSSSIRRLVMGKPPVNTPDSDALYGGEDDREYFKVEISDPDGPTFLPSEARKICTPPLPSDGPRQGRSRGFFFDHHPPDTDDSPSDGGDTPRAVAENSPSTKPVAAARSLGRNDWYSVLMSVEDAQDTEEHFELNVPEHLLGSPLCPRSPMHKSGGKEICVYHGRN